ncbi:integrase [Dysgonomonas sp. PH5-45]|uniref:phage integrase SAM-like domain-containing protein n=1 Tax=unclassified Dysgonomonas TaxID=2630389 RepID=UPI0024759A06|nr:MULTISPECIES: phage integrase SAM-like domain-containing protein [unclassified Dysgonomonas]MDH6355535.1 integrase [Dysgonomonas sp. PH5-45]MDH6388404.1 integrase [Dysgonomonas sp. PH5-37]
MEVSFYLRKELLNKNGLAPIRMHITFNGQLIKKSIKGVNTKPDQWKDKRMRIRANYKTEEYNFHVEYNQILDDLEERIRDIERYALLNKVELTKEFILDKLEQKQKINIEHDFFDTFNEYIESQKPISAKNTTKGRITVRNFLKDFSSYTGKQLLLDNIDISFFEEFRKYSYEQKNINNNYFSKIISILKTFMTWASDREYHNNHKYLKFNAPEEEIEVICLTPDELLMLYNFEFESDRLDKTRDLYCFGCFTGLRFSDLRNLAKSSLYKDYLKGNIIKTKNKDHFVPLNKYSIAILDKYKNTPFQPIPIISSQNANKYIKECCKIVGIDTITTITRYKGSVRQDETRPKYGFITMHTGRKTFATVSLILGMGERFVKSITGHKRDSSFRRYVKFSQQDIQKQMENTWDKL